MQNKDQKLLKIASVLYVSYAGFAFFFGGFIFYKRGSFASDLIEVNVYIFSGAILVLLYGLWLNKLNDRQNLRFLAVIASLLITVGFGFFVRFNVWFGFALLPCILVSCADLAKLLTPNR